jgi:hypothetical protein
MGLPIVVVAGLPVDGKPRIVGRSVPLAPPAARALGRELRPPTGPHPWPAQVSPATVNGFGFGGDRVPVDLTLVERREVQVAADMAWSGRTLRHPLRFVRTRPELRPNEVRVPAHLGAEASSQRLSRGPRRATGAPRHRPNPWHSCAGRRGPFGRTACGVCECLLAGEHPGAVRSCFAVR